MMIWPGIFVNGKLMIRDIESSCIKQVLRSIYGTCSFMAVVLRFASSGIESWIHSNPLSIRNVFILYHLFL